MNMQEYIKQFQPLKRYTFAYWFSQTDVRHYMYVFAYSKEEALNHFMHTPEYYSCYSCFSFPLKEESVEFTNDGQVKFY